MKNRILVFVLLLAILGMPCLSACKGLPLALFAASISSGEAPLLVTFTNTSENADAYHWDFGDGDSTTTSTVEETVNHEYTQAGEYVAVLTASRIDKPEETSIAEVAITVTPGALAEVSVMPETAQLDIGGSQEFTVVCTDAYGNEIQGYQLSWSVDANIGSINLGSFTAGTKAGVFPDAIVANAKLGDDVVRATASVTVTPGFLEALSIVPVEVAAGGTQKLEMSAVDEYGNQIMGLVPVWTLLDEKVGTITTDGLLIANKKAGEYYNAVEVTVKQGDVEKQAKARIKIIPGALDQIGIAPDVVNLGIEMEQQYVAVAADEYGNIISNPDFVWSADGDAGTITDEGLFTTGSAPGTYRDGVSVELTKDGVTLSASADVTVEPDRIIYLSNEHDEDNFSYEIYVIDANGQNKLQITTIGGNGVMADVDCSSDGRRIAFFADNTIYIANTDGNWLIPVITDVEILEFSWSPDGKKLVYALLEGGYSNIYTVEIDGSNTVQLTDNPAYDFSPSWSPDGQKIAFTSGRSGSWEIYVMNADGSNEEQITDDEWSNLYPQWSPDSSEIIFQSDRRIYYWGIYIMNADGSDVRRVYAPEDNHAQQPSFSPDGSKIVFTKSISVSDFDVCIVNQDGSNRTYITDNTAQDIFASWLNRKSGIDVSEASINIVDKTAEYEEMTIQEVTALVRQAVVRIVTDKGSGSGFIIDSDGLILTNNHVISDAEEITVYLEDGTEYEGTVQARDILHDLAVVKIEAHELPALEMGSFNEADLGQQVIVLGYPLGNENISVTSGLVSAIEYDDGTNTTYIQTDSAVNPGNSGGPLLNMNGQVIGMVAAKMVGEAIEGIGYAISIVTINTYLEELLGNS